MFLHINPLLWSDPHEVIPGCGLSRSAGHSIRLSFLLIFSITIPQKPAAADTPGFHTDRVSGKMLPLPKGDGVFHFVIFGDRTGGPAEGIKVLAQAVEDANLLDPDLVMTVGDLVNGYNQTDAWMDQMREFQETMNALKMPWFPVAGNHDIYWRRSSRNPEPKPPREHEDHYEKHFGPLWYWFEHKNAGFLVLFSDEGHPDGRPRDFGDREQQRISHRQLDWIAAELRKMQRLKHVFVFLHHPFWWDARYPGSNWDQVHALLAANGNVRAVFAGHIHQMRYDGVRDGIEYYALATTGGSLTPGMQYRHFGLLHHFNVVTVRDQGISTTAIPVGAVFDPKQFTPERLEDVEAARYTLHEFVSPPIEVQLDGSASAPCQVAVSNACSLPIEVTLLAKGAPGWFLAPDHRHAQIQPGTRRVFDFLCARDATPTLDGLDPPEFELRFDVLTPEARLSMPTWTRQARLRLASSRDNSVSADAQGVFDFNGQDACLEIHRDDLPTHNGPFTVEAWVNPAKDNNGAVAGNAAIGGFALDAAGAPRFSVQTDPSPADSRKAARLSPWITARAAEPLPANQWSHLAGVFDGREIVLYVNGLRAASAPATGARLNSNKSLYIGARPNGSWNLHDFSYPAAFWNGSIRGVRLSRGARYTAEFKPDRSLNSDESALFSLSGNCRIGPFVVVDSNEEIQATIRGDVKQRAP